MPLQHPQAEPSLFPLSSESTAPKEEPVKVDKAVEYRNHCKSIAASIIDGMRNGGEWTRPWQNGIQLARNRVTGRYYSGRNLLVLWNACAIRGFSSNEWATFNQWRSLGSGIKRGEKGTLICIAFPKPLKNEKKPSVFEFEGETSDDEPSTGKFWHKMLYLFNVDQVTRQDPDQTDAFRQISPSDHRLNRFIATLNPSIVHDPNQASYNVRNDKIRMPSLVQFTDTDEGTALDHYHTTLLHEMVHWTSHSTRCSRSFWGPRTSRRYAFEELVAEFGSAFLAAHFKTEQLPVQNHSYYIRSWYHMLELNPSYLFDALNHAVYASLWMLREVTPEDYLNVVIRKPTIPDERMKWLNS